MTEITPNATSAVPVTVPVAQTKAKAIDGSVRMMRSAVPTLRVVRQDPPRLDASFGPGCQ